MVDLLGESEAAKDVDRRGASYGLGKGLRMTKLPIGTARGFYAPRAETVSDAIPGHGSRCQNADGSQIALQ